MRGPRFAGTEVAVGGQSLPPGGRETHVTDFNTKEEPEHKKAGAVLPEPAGHVSDGTRQSGSESGSEKSTAW